jgi:CDP-2,3-bis-(O-geranylgeranyl)-sn-glycerol synthase
MNELVYFLAFFIPAYAANMLPVFVRKLPWLNYPLDGWIKFHGERLLGVNKTVRGFVFGVLGGGVVALVMQIFSFPITWVWGLILGFSALLGDAIKSFFKRRVHIKPGGTWIPFDQLDFIIVCYGATLLGNNAPWNWYTVLLGFVVIFVATLLVQFIGGRTKLKADSL